MSFISAKPAIKTRNLLFRTHFFRFVTNSISIYVNIYQAVMKNKISPKLRAGKDGYMLIIIHKFWL